jgi:hypothetical protein
MSDNYARACASPRRLELGGETVYVHKLTPRAIGDIQAFFVERLQNPFEAARDAIADMEDDEAREYWVAAYMEAKDTWPPDIHSEIGVNLLSCHAGRATLVWALGRRHTRGLTRDKADAIGAAMTEDEFFALYALAAPGEVGDLRNPGNKGDGLPYTEIRCKLCERYPGWTFDAVDNMTFEQIGQAWNGGKPVEITLEDSGQIEDTVSRWREYYAGL